MSDADQARDVAPPAARWSFWSYLGGVTAAGNAVLAVSVGVMAGADLTRLIAMPVFWLVMALVILGEVRPIFTAGAADPTGIATSTAFTFASLIAIGLPVAAVLHAIATVLMGLIRRRAWWRTAFNVAQYVLSLSAAWLVLVAFGADATIGHPHVPTSTDLPALLAAAAAYFLVNNGLVWTAITIREERALLEIVREDAAFQLVAMSALLGLAPLVALVMLRAPALLPLFLLPLLAVHKNAAESVEQERAAYHDALTGLGNRTLLVDRAEDALAAARRTGVPVGLFLLDLDRFKEVNDTLGHAAGDRVLQIVASRLKGSLRPGDVVARLGGDEFGVLLPEVRDTTAAVEVADRVRAALEAPFHIDEVLLDIEASIGVALSPQHGDDFAQLFQHADVAMYVAKSERYGVEVYAAEKDRNSTERLGLLGALRRGIDAGELEVHYQPKVDLRDDSVVGVEALVRWRHPERGLVPPDEFIPLAEESGLMHRLTDVVIDVALEQAALWWRDGMKVPVAVNVSMRDLLDPGFGERLGAGLARHGVPAEALDLEITERVLGGDPGRAARTLSALRSLGVEVSLDDFGTGYSSLLQLKRLPVSEIKIDRSFVGRLDVAEDDSAIVRSIIELAHALHLRVVAEGVETADSYERLRVLGCDQAQGWYIARAMPAQEATRWLHERRGSGAQASERALHIVSSA